MVKDRLKFFIKSIGLSVAEFEKSIYVSNGYVNSISKSIGIDKINLMLEKYPNLNIEWLLTGKGNMLKNASSGADEAAPADKMTENLQYIIELQKEKIARLEAELAAAQNKKRNIAANH